MTIAVPRVMPTVGIISSAFRLRRTDFLSQDQGGRLGGMGAGQPLWSMKTTLGNMTFDNADIVSAFVDRQRGPQRLFVAYDVDRQDPRFHARGIAYSPTAASWSQTIDSDGTAYLSLAGLSAGQRISTGDYIGFIWDDWKRALVRAMEPAGADAAGAVTFEIEPAVPNVVPGTAVAVLRQAGCLMRLVPGQVQLGENGLGYVAAGGSIAALQDLIP